MKPPLCIELFAGCCTWSAGWLDIGGQALGFDIEHLPHHGPVPDNAQLVLQDVLTLDGAQFKDASLILASPPCQAYSYRAMPWSRAKALPPPSNELFDACFRIQAEACAAAGRYIPMVVENVRGAQKWVGRARWHFGSYFLWGDVPAIMPFSGMGTKIPGMNWSNFGKEGYKAEAFNGNAEKLLRQEGLKQSGKSRRKAAAANIARIPYPLSLHIARTYYPEVQS